MKAHPSPHLFLRFITVKRHPVPAFFAKLQLDNKLFLLLLGGVMGLTSYLILDRRMPRGHDGFQYFSLQYYFLNHTVEHGEIPFWMPYMTHGTVSTWWYAVQSNLFQNVALWTGKLLKPFNFLTLFHIGMAVDELLLLVGMWLWSRHFFDSPLTRFFITFSALASAVWYDQPWHNFHAYYALPLILEFGHRFFDTGKWRYLAASGHLLILQIFGNMPYGIPMTSFIIFIYFLSHFLLFPIGPWKIVSTSKWVVRGILVLIGLALFLGLAHRGLTEGTQEIINYNISRNPDGTSPLTQFLSYSTNLHYRFWFELFLGVSPSRDLTLFLGATSFASLLALFFTRLQRKQIPPLVVVLCVVSLGSGGILAFILYHCWPTMNYYRHLTLACAMAKPFLCILCGFGFQAFYVQRTLRQRPFYLLGFLFLVLGLGLFLLSQNRPLTMECINEMTFPNLFQGLELKRGNTFVRFLVLNSVTFCALACLFLSQTKISLNRASWVFLTIHILSLGFYQFNLTQTKTFSLSDEQDQVNQFMPLPYPIRRDQNHRTNPRFAPFANNLFRTSRGFVGYGSHYWSTESYLFQDLPSSPFRTDHWLVSFDNLLRTYLRQPLGEFKELPLRLDLVLQFPLDHPSARKVIGVSEDKIQFFRNAEFLFHEKEVAARIVSPQFQGNQLFLTASEGKIQPYPMEMENKDVRSTSLHEQGSLSLPYLIQRFDSNTLQIQVNVPTGGGNSTTPSRTWLQYGDTWHSSWKTTVNGTAVPIYKGNLAYKAVPLIPGPNTVLFRFFSPILNAIYALLAVSSLCWIVWIVSQTLSQSHKISDLHSLQGTPVLETETPATVPQWIETMRGKFCRAFPWMAGFFIVVSISGALVYPKVRNHLFLYSAGHGRLHACQFLLRCGADVNTEDSLGVTALKFAASQGHPDVVRALIQSGARVDQVGADTETALFYAVKSRTTHFDSNSSKEIFKHLLDGGAQIDFRNRTGITVLMYAVGQELEELCTYLLQRGANPNAQDHLGQHALLAAALTNNRQILRLLIQYGAKLDLQNHRGQTALMHAVNKGHLQIAAELLRAGANPWVRTDDGRDALSIAQDTEQKPLIKLLQKYWGPWKNRPSPSREASIPKYESDR